MYFMLQFVNMLCSDIKLATFEKNFIKNFLPNETSLSVILRILLIFQQFEPHDSYKKDSYYKSVYIREF